MSDMLYDNDCERYFSDVEVACDWYWETPPAEVPEFLYGTKPLVIEDSLIERLSESVLSYIDTNGDELSGEGDDGYFSECLKSDAIEELENFLKNWLQRNFRIIELSYYS